MRHLRSKKAGPRRNVWSVTKAALAAVPVPAASDTYIPVPYSRLVEELELHIPRFGLTILDESFALAQDRQQMFGVLTCRRNGADPGYALAIGIRSSYNKTLSAGIVSGVRVHCSGGLAFSGAVSFSRKHTPNVFRDLPDLIYRMLSRLSPMQEQTDTEIARMRDISLTPETVDHLLMEAMRRGAIPPSCLPHVVEAWERPGFDEFRPRTAWSLYHAVAIALRRGRSPRRLIDHTLRLTEVFRSVLGM